MQHAMAVRIADMLRESCEIPQERILLIYGIEAFLNEFLKAAICLVIAVVFRCWQIVILNMIFLKLLRQYAGGRHFKKNIICGCVSVVAIVTMAIWGDLIILPRKIQIVVLGIEMLIFIVYAPYQNERIMSVKTRFINKVLTLLVFTFGIGLAWEFGADYYFNNFVFVAGISSLMLIKIKSLSLS